jgi:hypothetical protein
MALRNFVKFNPDSYITASVLDVNPFQSSVPRPEKKRQTVRPSDMASPGGFAKRIKAPARRQRLARPSKFPHPGHRRADRVALGVRAAP